MNNVSMQIDFKSGLFRALIAAEKNFSDIKIYETPLPTETLGGNESDYITALNEVLPRFLRETNVLPATASFVLPSTAVSCDLIKVPALGIKKLPNIAKIELQSQLPNSEEFNVTSSLFSVMEKQSTHFFTLVKTNLIDNILSTIQQFKFSSRRVTFAGATELDALLRLRPLRRKQLLMFADIHENRTEIVFSKNSELLGFHTFSFGLDVLKCGKKLTHCDLPAAGIATSLDTAEQESANLEHNFQLFAERLVGIAENFRIQPITVVYNIPTSYSSLFDELETTTGIKFRYFDPLVESNKTITDNLDLFGAFQPYNKDLYF